VRWIAVFGAVACAGVVLAYAGSNASGAATAPPPPQLLNLAASSHDDAALISWQGTSTDAYTVTIDDDADFTSPQQLDAVGTTATAQGLKPDTTYYVRVSTPDGEKTQTLSTSFNTAPLSNAVAAPKLSLDVSTSNQVAASWKTMADSGAKFQVQLSNNKKLSKPVSKTIAEPSYAFEDLAPNTTYYARVRALGTDGAAISDWSDVETAKTLNTTPLTVATFNVGCYKCTTKSLPKWETRRDAVATRINTEAPDVLGIEELSQSKLKGAGGLKQYQDLMNRLDKKYMITSCGTSRSASICKTARNETGVIYNSDTVEALDTGFVALPKASGHITRYMSWALLREKSTGKEFLFGVAHLEPAAKFASVRAKQAATVASVLKQHGLGSGLPTFMVGDFNSHADAAPYRTMINAGLNDPLGRKAGAQRTAETRIHTNYNSFNWYKRNPPHSSGTAIDFIFTTQMRVSQYETVVKLGSNGKVVGTIPSDHNMVRAVVWLP